MPGIETSISAVLAERARQEPDTQGFEYIVGALGAVGGSPNDIDFEASRKDPSVNSFLADIDTFDAEFFEISPIKEIRSKGRAGV